MAHTHPTDPSTWQRPGLRAAILYALATGLLSSIVSAVSRPELTRRAVSDAELPDGPVIVVANHTSFAGGVLLGLVGPVVRRLGFIPVLRGGHRARGR